MLREDLIRAIEGPPPLKVSPRLARMLTEESRSVSDAARARAEDMYFDLLANKQEIILVPSRDYDCAARGGMIRVAQSRPPAWFSELASLYPKPYNFKHNRKRNRTIIYRHAVLRALERLMTGDCSTLYCERLLDFIERKMKNEAIRRTRF